MTFPTMVEVKTADREQICRWHRFLPSAMTEENIKVQTEIHKTFISMGGFTPELSKLIGWDR